MNNYENFIYTNLNMMFCEVEDLTGKLNSQEVELTLKNQAAEALMARIGLQTERVSQKKEDADLEEQKVEKSKTCDCTQCQDGNAVFPLCL